MAGYQSYSLSLSPSIPKEFELEILDKIVKKSGRFLKEKLMDKNLELTMTIEVTSAILDQCHKLENNNLGFYDFEKRTDLLATKAIIHKLKKLHCNFYPSAEDTNDED